VLDDEAKQKDRQTEYEGESCPDDECVQNSGYDFSNDGKDLLKHPLPPSGANR
jgi:hypothetical protein